ncbi:uncharacterized protein LOC121677337 [Arvicola amphibius]|uniref:uncharacterized protein LOC121677337 n=1 Tax=Arvicola amphibius TaxID=1047088 RepID=UPI001C09DB97|nr:uncharacterized protein LOC121677337 [Arvicola amphibius]
MACAPPATETALLSATLVNQLKGTVSGGMPQADLEFLVPSLSLPGAGASALRCDLCLRGARQFPATLPTKNVTIFIPVKVLCDPEMLTHEIQGSEAANPRCPEAGLLAPWFFRAFLRELSPFTKTLQVRASAWSWGERVGSQQEAWFPSSQVSAVGLCVGDSHPRVSHIGQGSTRRRGIETNAWFQGEGTCAPPCSSLSQ